MEIIDAVRTAAALDFPRLVPALREMFITGCTVPPRHHHHVPGQQGDSTLLLMPAWLAGRFMGVKVVAVAPANSARGLPGVSSTYLLSDAETGVPLALIDGTQITSRRTAAASALAADFLARPDASNLLVVGSGQVASLLPAAYGAVRPIRTVTVWNHRQESAVKLVQRLQADGIDARLADNLPAAVAQADVVSCATLAAAPVIRGEWLRPGTHVDLIGSFTPAMREADDEVVRRSRLFVDTRTALEESGDLVHPLAAGIITPEWVEGDLGELCRGDKVGRRDLAEITCFKSVGTALEDLAAAILVHESLAGEPKA